MKYVYLAKDQKGLYKIGITGSPKERIAHIRARKKTDFKFIAVIPYAEDYLESFFIKYFAEKCVVTREWFNLDQEDERKFLTIKSIYLKLKNKDYRCNTSFLKQLCKDLPKFCYTKHFNRQTLNMFKNAKPEKIFDAEDF